MSFEPVVFVNGVSQAAVAVISLLLALKLRKGKNCILQKPFYLLAMALTVMALLNITWARGLIHISALDNLLVLPFFHLAILAVWFYIGLFISGHEHIYYLIPLFIMSINGFLLVSNLAVLSDVITGLVLLGIFFYIGFIDHHFIKKVSYTGMVYGATIVGAALLAQFTGIQHIESFWFVPNAVLFYMLFIMLMEGHVCASALKPAKHHLPITMEIFKLGFFVIGLSIFLMLGTLGVHELGHSLGAKVMSCAYTTSFGVGHAVTHVACESGSGLLFITLSGLIMTLLISLLMYFMGHDFAKRLALMILGFSLLISVDDFTSIGLPKSIFVALVFVSAILLGYGLMLIVKNYEKEYATYEAGVCASATSASCGGKDI
jgi:hypothetical protein